MLINSKLSTAILGRVWELSDLNADGKLDTVEFAVVRERLSVFLADMD